MIAPIQTTWDNCHFRSRLEARWAVTLTALNIPFLYEEEAYNIPGKGGYVPDFYLPETRAGQHTDQTGCFLEIKPDVVPEGRESPTMELSSLTRTPVVTFFGFPFDAKLGNPHSMQLFFEQQDQENAYIVGPSGGMYCDNHHMFGMCNLCGSIEIQHMGKAERHSCDCVSGDKGTSFDSEPLLLAYNFAATYRF